MPPKVKVTREDIINAAVDIVRRNGAEAINARSLADCLNCSTQPIFSNFATMKELYFAVVSVGDELYRQYCKNEIEGGKYPEYKALGMAYIRFAKEEKELFKLLFMRDRSEEIIPPFPKTLSDRVQSNTGLNEKSAELFHIEIWMTVHGIATMTATNYLELDMELVSQMLTDVYRGLKKRYETRGE